MAKPTLTLEKGESEIVVRATGDLNVQHAYEIKNFFEAVMQEEANFHLHFGEATALDVSVIQFSYLLKLNSQRNGHHFKITMPEDTGLFDLMEKCGITKIL